MRTAVAVVIGLAVAMAVLMVGGVLYLGQTGLSARAEPASAEVTLARLARRVAVPSTARALANPVKPSPEVLSEAMAHYADHCATCHANDGSGNTEMGRGLYPRAPDMRSAATQRLTDGELFYVIENGIRFTGMPAWGTRSPGNEAATWALVHFIRRLPRLGDDELQRMKDLNPRSPEEIRQELEEERFLNQGAQ
jgi:mono/diheme cytochrome c family protein